MEWFGKEDMEYLKIYYILSVCYTDYLALIALLSASVVPLSALFD